MKYFRLSKDGEDLNVILACEDEDKERLAREKYGDQYELTECECPQGSQLVNEEPCIPNADIFMQKYRMMPGYDPFDRASHVVYDCEKCARCSNRFRRSVFCDANSRTPSPCYRFKLDRNT